MNLDIQSIHFDADQKLLAYVQKKCDKLDQFFNNITDGRAYLKVTKPQAKDNKEVEIKVNVPGETFIGKAQADTFEAATDLAVDKVKGQLKSYKEKLKAH